MTASSVLIQIESVKVNLIPYLLRALTIAVIFSLIKSV